MVRAIHGRSEVATFEGEKVHRASFSEVAERAERLAAALRRLGVGVGDRVGTFCWNHQEHLEAYLVIPSMGSVLHTLNIRLFPDQLAFVANHAEDRVIIVDDSLVPLLARVADQLKTVQEFIVIGTGDAAPLGEVLRYEDVLTAERPGFSWPDVDERSAAALCYTSGTTGEPKGVAYSHRSTFLHSMSVNTAAVLGLTESDGVLVIVPMFHANAWGTPYAGWMVGTDFVMPHRFLQAEPLTRLIALTRPTLSAGVPTIWNDILQFGKDHDVDLSSLRKITAGGSAVPRSLLEQFESRFGVRMYQGWGMTETSPVCALAYPPRAPRREGPRLAGQDRSGHPGRGDSHRRRRWQCRPVRWQQPRGDRGPGPLGYRLLLSGPGTRKVSRRLAAHRRRRQPGRLRIPADL